MKAKSWFWMFAAVLALSASGCTIVEDGQVGVRKALGKISDEPVGTGVRLNVPYIAATEVWTTKVQELEETADVPSSEGLIVQLDISVLFRVPPEKAPLIRKAIGPYYVQTFLIPYVRNAIRTVASGYEVKALYSEKGRKEIGERIREFLVDKLDRRGIIIQDVLLRDVQLPHVFAQSIEVKLKTEQEALQKEFELTKAKKDAEIEVARAEGVAKSNIIISNSITEKYLRYQWIQGLQKNDLQVVYVPTEAGLPIMEANRFKGDAHEK